MKISEYDYNLPSELIAQTPLEKRDNSKLMLLNKSNGSIEHKNFYDILNLLDENDVLVFNDTRVIPARLFGQKVDTDANIELLLLNETNDYWECLCKPAKRVKIGTTISFGNNKLIAECIAVLDDGLRKFKFIYDGIFYEILDELGEMPLPPYITEKLDEKDRYQTVYSKEKGSAAAPTAGLHFTNEIMKTLKDNKVQLEFVTLHVGLGTFRPVNVDDIKDHKMHSERYYLSDEVANRLNKYKNENKRIISVGTTTTRVLESCFKGQFKASSGETDIFIYPGYKFKAIDALITNFHLPKSTLLMLVSALSSKEYILNAYKEAIKNKYRFFSFGDSMFIY